MTTFNLSATSLNTGSYFGSGYSSVGTSGNRVASSMNLQRVSRDIAQGYNSDLEIVNLYLQQGDTDKALALYQSLIDDIQTTTSDYGYSLSDGQISSILNQAYANTTGQSFTTSAVDGAHSPFITGVLEGIPLIGMFNRGTSDAETLAKVSGSSTRLVDKVAEYAGSAIPGAVVGAAVCTMVPIPGVGTVLGGVIGGAIGVGQAVFKDIFRC